MGQIKNYHIYSGWSPWQVTASDGTIIPLPDAKYLNLPAEVTVSLLMGDSNGMCMPYYDVAISNSKLTWQTPKEVGKKILPFLAKKAAGGLARKIGFSLLGIAGGAIGYAVVDVFTPSPIASEVTLRGTLASGVPVVYWIHGGN